jgi:hypothetical protein
MSKAKRNEVVNVVAQSENYRLEIPAADFVTASADKDWLMTHKNDEYPILSDSVAQSADSVGWDCTNVVSSPEPNRVRVTFVPSDG